MWKRPRGSGVTWADECAQEAGGGPAAQFTQGGARVAAAGAQRLGSRLVQSQGGMSASDGRGLPSQPALGWARGEGKQVHVLFAEGGQRLVCGLVWAEECGEIVGGGPGAGSSSYGSSKVLAGLLEVLVDRGAKQQSMDRSAELLWASCA